MARALKTYNKQARQSLNMVNTVMRYQAKNAAHKVINNTAELADKQSFLDILNKAAGKAVTGAESRQAAMRQCIKEMTDKGIAAFVDKKGREWSPEAYINMDIRTTVSNVANRAQFERMDDYGINLVEISSHSGARPKCAKDQGKIFNRSGSGGYTTDLHGQKIRYYAWSDSSYGEPDGLLGINCGHSAYPFIPGVSYQTYFPYNEEENAEHYRKIQGQRELERRVRKSKRECMMLEKTGDTEGLQKASVTLKQRQDALKQYCSDNGLSYKSDRTAVVGYNKSISGKVNAINRRKTVDNSVGSDIIEENSKKSITPITDNSVEKIPKVKIKGYSDEQCEKIQRQHKELLKYSRDNNENKEVAFVFDNELKNRKEFKGLDDRLDFGSALYGKDLFVMHNHPRNSSYSDYDIQFFTTNDNVKSLSIIKNNGNVEVISKTELFTVKKMKTVYKRAFKKYVKQGTNEEIDKAIEYILKKNGGILEWVK